MKNYNVVIWRSCCQYFLPRLLHLSTCPNVDIPQDKIIGFWVSETFFIKGKFTKSTDAILKILHLKSSENHALQIKWCRKNINFF